VNQYYQCPSGNTTLNKKYRLKKNKKKKISGLNAIEDKRERKPKFLKTAADKFDISLTCSIFKHFL
jgi:hypothetical protein